MRTIEEPTITEKHDGLGGTEIRHPAFAQISVVRSSGQSHLYGSDFVHQHTIRLRVSESYLRRRLSDDSPHASGIPLLELTMSEAQWAHVISSVGVGEGTQCTLCQFNGQVIPELPAPKPRTEQFARESDAGLAQAMQSIQDAMAAVENSKLSKKDQATLLSKLSKARMDIGVNRDYVADRFAEHMEQVVEEGKKELNAYAQRTVQSGTLALGHSEAPLQLPGAADPT